ncbi:MAG: hypothetical protein NC310_00090 [Roseburia sp.]|nr:hypothetical protein [Anaeroplasma bactoclasticum]MCM1195453.1 hypothetical protein [Roseburia sp.]MCM1555932.1 hypothetical protein [Anaeroplasma bactoclasticum]
MKVCNSEAMKYIKELERQKDILLYTENNRSTISYKEGEVKQASKYDYEATRKGIEEINAKIRKIKHVLSIANTTTVVDGFDMTIGEALVYLAQLNLEYEQVSRLAARDKLSRRITANGVLEYTECVYDPEQAEAKQEEIYATIAKLQVAIDRANLTHFIEI